MNRRSFLKLGLFSVIGVLGSDILLSGEQKWKSKFVDVISTAYCPGSCCCGEYADGKTSTGRDAFKCGVAVDPNFIELGSFLDIPGYKRNNGIWIKADDIGGRVKNNHIDLRFKTHQEALDYGRKRIRIRVWTVK